MSSGEADFVMSPQRSARRDQDEGNREACRGEHTPALCSRSRGAPCDGSATPLADGCEEACAICLSPMGLRRPRYKTKCNHQFHATCVQRLRTFDLQECPLCRAELRDTGFTPKKAGPELRVHQRVQIVNASRRARDAVRRAMRSRLSATME